MLQTQTLLPIRYAETDRMGVVHHSHYPVYFEAGRTDFFTEHLIHYHQMESRGLFSPVLQLHVDIAGRATYGDTLVITTYPTWLKGLKFSMSYRVHLTSGAAVATGSTIHALCGPDLRPIHPRNFQDLYDLLETAFPRREGSQAI